MPAVRYMVTNVDEAIEFYTEILEFKLEKQMGSAIAEVSKSGLHLFLSGPERSAAQPLTDGHTPEPGGWNRILIETDDLDSLIENLRESDVTFRGEVVSGPGGKKILLEDGDKNLIELFEASQHNN